MLEEVFNFYFVLEEALTFVSARRGEAARSKTPRRPRLASGKLLPDGGGEGAGATCARASARRRRWERVAVSMLREAALNPPGGLGGVQT